MKWKFFIVLYVYAWCFWFSAISLPGKIKRSIWNERILLWWHRLWVRKEEMHQSLDMDIPGMLDASESEWEKYREDLVYRRKIAHQKNL